MVVVLFCRSDLVVPPNTYQKAGVRRGTATKFHDEWDNLLSPVQRASVTLT